jgi:8-oxo-dGTP pyrophosphatase MutT (NUDIX family)
MVLILEGDRLLFQRRVGTGAWHVPGGYMEPGEAIEETARREAKEETGLEIGKMTLVGVFSGPEFHWFAPNGDEVHNVTIAFTTRDFQGNLQADGEEGLEVKFFNLRALPDNLGPPAKPILDYFLKITSYK